MTSWALGNSKELRKACGSECDVGGMSIVRVMCGRNRCGEEKRADVEAISDVNLDVKGWEAGGRSQRDEPGILCGVVDRN